MIDLKERKICEKIEEEHVFFLSFFLSLSDKERLHSRPPSSLAGHSHQPQQTSAKPIAFAVRGTQHYCLSCASAFKIQKRAIKMRRLRQYNFWSRGPGTVFGVKTGAPLIRDETCLARGYKKDNDEGIMKPNVSRRGTICRGLGSSQQHLSKDKTSRL